MFCCVNAAFRLCAALGNHYTTTDVEVLICIDAVVVDGSCIDVSAIDIKIVLRVDGIVVAVAFHGTCFDVNLAFALDGFGAVARAFKSYLSLSTFDGDVSVGFDAFWRDAALRVFFAGTSGDDMNGAVVDDNLVVTVQSLAADACRFDIELTAVDGNQTVGFDARAGRIVFFVAVVFVAAAGENGGASAVPVTLMLMTPPVTMTASLPRMPLPDEAFT